MKHNFLDIDLTMFFGTSISVNTSPTRVISFWKVFKINIDFKNSKKKKKEKLKKVFVFEKIASELVVFSCLYLADNASDGDSLCVNMLTNSLRILYITKSDFFQRNYLYGH